MQLKNFFQEKYWRISLGSIGEEYAKIILNFNNNKEA